MNLSGIISEAFTHFLQLLEFPQTLFKCCDTPHAICLDGIVLSIGTQRIAEKKLKRPWIKGDSKQRATTRKCRAVLPTTKVDRDLFQTFVREGINFQQFCSINVKYYNKESVPNPVVNLMFGGIQAEELGRIYECDPLLKPLYRCIAKDICPAISIAPASVWSHIEGVIDGNTPVIDPVIYNIIESNAPIACDIILYWAKHSDNLVISSLAAKALRHIITLAKSSVDVVTDNTIDLDNPICVQDERNAIQQTGQYFPGRPVYRDVKTVTLSRNETRCTKNTKQSGKLGAGVLLFWCASHRICIGWTLLTEAESPKSVYDVLATRFQKMPQYIIYDNACNLFEYCHNRSPHLFRDTVFLSDAFHWVNHINCGCCFNSRIYSSIESYSSVVHEQKNAFLAKHKKTSPRMRYDTFVELLCVVLATINYRENGYSMGINIE